MTPSWDKIRTRISSLKDLTAVGFANIAVNAISALFWLYMARLLDTEGYGEISYLLSVAGLAGTITFLGAGNTLIVYRAKQVKIQASIYSFVLISAVVTSTTLFFILHNFGASVYVIGYVFFGLAMSELLGTKLYRSYAKHMLSQRILLIVFALTLYYVIGLQGIVLGFGLSFFPYSILVYKGFKESKVDLSLIRIRFRFIINSYVLELTRSLNAYIDKLIIAPIFGFSLLANYYLGVQVISVLGLLPSIVFQYVLPREASGQSNKKLKKVAILTSVLLATLTIILSPILLPIFFPKFDEAVLIVQIMSLNVIPVSINLTYISKFLASEKSKIVLIGSCVFLSVQIPAIFVLGHLYNINGVAIALVLSQASESIYLITSNKLLAKRKNTSP